jgi:HK97 family phage major capsid protein
MKMNKMKMLLGSALIICAALPSLAMAAVKDFGHDFAEIAHVGLQKFMYFAGMVAYDADPTFEAKMKGELEKGLLKVNDELKSWIEKANEEVKNASNMSTETKSAVEKLSLKASEIVDRLLALEQKWKEAPAENSVIMTLGEQFIKSDAWAQAVANGGGKARMEVKAAIVNATGQNQPLVQDQRLPGIIQVPNRVFTIRDLLPVGQTSSNLIQFTKENVFTNNAGPQYSSPNYENVTKPESSITFTIDNAPVVTLAHWIPISKQVLDDAPQLQSYVNTRLMYGLKLEEEDQLLNGSGVAGNLKGLLTSGNNRAYDRAQTGDTMIDTLRRSITQAQLSEYPVDGIVLNWEDWEEIELTKATDGQYIMANPLALAGPTLWGRRVVPTNAIAQGTFLTGAFGMGAQIWDRQQASVQISFEDGTNFVKNMATLLAEERLAFTVYRPQAFIKGTF